MLNIYLLSYIQGVLLEEVTFTNIFTESHEEGLKLFVCWDDPQELAVAVYGKRFWESRGRDKASSKFQLDCAQSWHVDGRETKKIETDTHYYYKLLFSFVIFCLSIQ